MKSFYVQVTMKVLIKNVSNERDARNHAVELLQEFIEKSKDLCRISDISNLSVLSATTISGSVDE
jgi:hypothetical protein